MGAAAFFFSRAARAGNADAVLEGVAVEGARRYRAIYEAYKESTGLAKMGAIDRFNLYQARSDGQWAILRQAFPEDYAKQTADWVKLLSQRIRGQTLSAVANPPYAPVRLTQ